jgi:hypothetical protein
LSIYVSGIEEIHSTLHNNDDDDNDDDDIMMKMGMILRMCQLPFVNNNYMLLVDSYLHWIDSSNMSYHPKL